jgi:peptide-methionine (S)-S-oxide reductase
LRPEGLSTDSARNRQGWDIGTQYRSAIFVHDADQMTAALASREARQQAVGTPIVTEIDATGPFYEAEAYHQQFFEKHGGGACAVTIEVPDGASLLRATR